MAETTKAKPKSKMRYESSELSLIKSVFSENQAILIALRKVFFQAPLNKAEVELLKPISQSKEVQMLLRKTYLPTIELDAPLGQIIDLWLTVDNSEKTPMEAKLALQVRSRLMYLIEAGLKRFDDLTGKPTENILDYKPDFSMDEEAIYVEFTARNAIITHSEFQLTQIAVLAERKDETPEEAKKRFEQNSNR